MSMSNNVGLYNHLASKIDKVHMITKMKISNEP
jgi:hypothetical protein